jgi:hypothetical protein
MLRVLGVLEVLNILIVQVAPIEKKKSPDEKPD